MKTWCAMAAFLVWMSGVGAVEEGSAPRDPAGRGDAEMQRKLEAAVAAALREFAPKKLQSNQLAATFLDLSEPGAVRRASYRGDVPVYPASVVKLFYLAATHRWLEDGKLKEGAELRRALRDMIVESSNDATHYVLDALTDTTSGPELLEAEMKEWGEKRNAVNRFFASLGYDKINVNQKPWCEGPYGRDRIWVGADYGNRNALTTDATARLLSEIAQRQFVSSAHCAEMLALLRRDPANEKDGQARFTVASLPAGAKLYSKAGWTSTTRHDAAYLEFAPDKRFILVTFTTGHAGDKEIIPFIARRLVGEPQAGFGR